MPLFDQPHLILLVTVFALSVLGFGLGRREYGRQAIPYLLVICLISAELSIALLAWQDGLWNYRWALPLQLCDVALIFLVIHLLYPMSWTGELAYFWVMGGSIAALLTPDIGRSFPDSYYLLFFATHGTAVVSVCYLLGAERITVQRSSLWRVWLITHFYALLIVVFNSLFDTNYLFLSAKPQQFSPLDYLGPWPNYLLGLELFFLAALFLWYGIYQRLTRC